MIFEVEVKLHKDDLKIEKNRICIGIQATPENGKANEELITKLSKHFGVAKSDIKILRGKRSRKKVVSIL